MEKKARTPMNKQMKSLLYKATSLVLLGIFMCTAVFGYLSRSFGWFSDNTEVSASGMSVQSSDGLNVEATIKPGDGGAGYVHPEMSENNTLASFQGLTPGTKMLLQIQLLNFEGTDVEVVLNLASPSANEDVAVVTSGQYTYFGAHLRLNSFKVTHTLTIDPETKTPSTPTALSASDIKNVTHASITPGTAEYIAANEYLLTLDEKYHKEHKESETQTRIVQSTLCNEAHTFGDAVKTLTNGIEIPKNSGVIVTLELEFVDNDLVQNPLINFGVADTNQICSRKIICTTTEN